MTLREFIARRARVRQLPLLAADIAQRSRVDVWRRVSHRAGTMVLAEARGYIRARAAEAVAAHLRQATESGGWTANEQEQLRRQSLDQVVRLVLVEMTSRRPVSTANVRQAA